MTQSASVLWIEKLKTAKKAGLLQNGNLNFYYPPLFFKSISRSKENSLHIR
jgi:hypothetical protein